MHSIASRVFPCVVWFVALATGTRCSIDTLAAEVPSPPKTPPAKRIALPAKFNVFIDGRRVEDLADAFRSESPKAVATVEDKLNRAESWAAHDDSWYLERTASFTPVGLWTIACPFHPEKVRDFSPDNFEWSIDDPWRLHCPLCRAEGRKPDYYPNQRYPDDGTGCYPTDENWRADRDADWSKAHGGIAWDHWDGSPHGYSASGYCYYFLGKCAQLIMTFECSDVLPALAEGYVVAQHIVPPDDSRHLKAATYARRVKVALFCRARAHLGDEYLSKVAGLSESEYRKVLKDFYGENAKEPAIREFPGYTPYGLQDGILGDKKHPARGAPDIYADGSFRGDLYARQWLLAYALIRDAYTKDEELVRQMTERLLVSAKGDTAAVPRSAGGVKKGKLEIALQPYDMTVGKSNNLGGRELAAKFEFGRLLGDEQAVDAVVSNVRYYLRNYFSGDGLGREGSGGYTLCAWNTLSQTLSRLHGYRGHYDASHPWWDARTGGLNPYRDPYLKTAAAKCVLSLYPSGCLIPWMDSHVHCRFGDSGSLPRQVKWAANEGGGIPAEYREFFTTASGANDQSVVGVRQPLNLPSILHHELRKAVLRSGRGQDQTVLGIDYAANTGHWHPAPMDLVLFAKGHELASDLGYFGAMSSLTRNWLRTCESHNTCIVRSADGKHEFMHQVQGDIQELADLGGRVQVVGVAERNAEVLPTIPGDDPRFERTSVLVSLDESAPYVVDLFRVHGGAIHDYMFHSPGRQFRAEQVKLQENSDPAMSLYDVSGFTCRQVAGSGSRAIGRIRHAATDKAFGLTWSQVPDWDADGKVDESVGLRLTMLGHAGTELFVGEAPGQRRMNNADLGEKLHVACIRRPNTDTANCFLAVIEPYRGTPSIVESRRLPTDGTTDAVAIEIELPDRTDVILLNPSQDDGAQTCSYRLTDGRQLDTDASFATLSMTGGEVRYFHTIGGTRAQFGDVRLDLGAPCRGKLISFDDRRRVMVVETNRPLSAGAALGGSTLIVRHARGTSTFTIDRVKPTEGSRHELSFRWTPHLGENYFRVIDVEGNWVRLQPPPSLSRDFSQLRYQLYQAGMGSDQTHCGEIGRCVGEWFEAAEGSPHAVKGSEVMLTRLNVTHDEVLITNRLVLEGERCRSLFAGKLSR